MKDTNDYGETALAVCKLIGIENAEKLSSVWLSVVQMEIPYIETVEDRVVIEDGKTVLYKDEKGYEIRSVKEGKPELVLAYEGTYKPEAGMAW